MIGLKDFTPKSLLAFIVALSIVAYLGGISSHNDQLAAEGLIFGVFAVFFVAFLTLSLARNVKRF